MLSALVLKSGKSTTKLNGVKRVGWSVGEAGKLTLSEVGYSKVDESPLNRNLLLLTSGSKL